MPSRRQFSLLIAAAGLAAGVSARAQDDLPPNVFISPCGQPFRARRGAPYPVVDWFHQADKNGDGKLDHAEFLADTEAFFKILDRNGDGVVDGAEVRFYENRIAPEVLGYRVDVSALSVRGWLRYAQAPDNPLSAPVRGRDDREPQDHPSTGFDDSQQGAAPYGFFAAPEPIASADPDARGVIYKKNFLALAERHFAELDASHAGYLTLAGLPKTPAQRALERALGRRRG
ncbi:MAG TPA: hypothetical protein VKU90_02785 [Caulobacteraceae bacterium]|nr:hypothetical protein [Caulobacteraceae bacterium]